MDKEIFAMLFVVVVAFPLGWWYLNIYEPKTEEGKKAQQQARPQLIRIFRIMTWPIGLALFAMIIALILLPSSFILEWFGSTAWFISMVITLGIIFIPNPINKYVKDKYKTYFTNSE